MAHVGFVFPADVVFQPALEKSHEMEVQADPSGGEIFPNLHDLLFQPFVLGFVALVTRVVRHAEKAFFHGEMDGGVLHQFIQDPGRACPGRPVDHGLIDPVDDVHQQFVLGVDFIQPHG